MPSTIHIRSTTSADLAPLAQVYTALYATIATDEHWEPDAAQRMLAYYFTKHPELAYTAVCDEQIVGAFLSGIKPWWDGNHLFDGEIFVARAMQRHGVGHQLLQAVFAAARQHHNAIAWDFFTLAGRDSPVAWYQKIGFDIPEGYVMMSGSLAGPGLVDGAGRLAAQSRA